MSGKIDYWVELAEYDLETARAMLKSKRYLYVGFMCHQAIEKVLKAFFVKSKGEQPPRTHNLRLIAKKSELLESFDEGQFQFLISLEPLHIEARYPTEKEKIFKSLSHERCVSILQSTEELFQWIKAKL